MIFLLFTFCSMCVVTEAHTVMNTLPGPVTFQGVKIGGQNQTASITVKTSVDMADAQGNKTHFNIPANALASNSVVSINPGRGQRCNLMLYPSNLVIFGE